MTTEAFDERDAALSELLGIRSSIDNIDAALIHLLAERFKFTQQVGRLKAAARPAAERPGAREAPDRPAAGARRGSAPRPGVRREVVQLRRRRGHPPPRAARQRRRGHGRRRSAGVVSWNPSPLPSQAGRVVLVTGANAGIGSSRRHGSRARARTSCSSGPQPRTGDAAMRAIRSRAPRHPSTPLELDTASLDSVRGGAASCSPARSSTAS